MLGEGLISARIWEGWHVWLKHQPLENSGTIIELSKSCRTQDAIQTVPSFHRFGRNGPSGPNRSDPVGPYQPTNHQGLVRPLQGSLNTFDISREWVMSTVHHWWVNLSTDFAEAEA